eukprot:TRINITY_DN18933_c0_g1_i1.p1 TRINITY_DN18933_c0_g1~~TRINITY_DN18933_c0_g1_i1.p1  ORF type:complete len:207 (-),score=36.23 TRINITY_DN18933_c0_g1_i1:327-863(-)
MKRNDNCRYTTIRRYHCATHRESDAEAPVQKCEKTVQVLRQCADRPAEVVESKTEYTEGDVPSEMLSGSRMEPGFGHQGWPSRSFEDGSNVWSRSLLGGFEELVQAAEELAQGFLGSGFAHDEKQSGLGVRGFLERLPPFSSEDGSFRKSTPDPSPASGGQGGKPANFPDFSGGCQEV